MLRQLPNCLTALRILLVAPLGWLILREQYPWALGLGVLAGITDGLDGYLARRLQAQTRLGAILDPLADKALVIVVFLCLAQVGLVPWPLALLVVVRDAIIVSGAACYHFLIGEVEMSPLQLSKWNMAVQISFCALVLFNAVTAVVPESVLHWGHLLVAVMAVATGAGYIAVWSRKAWENRDAGRR